MSDRIVECTLKMNACIHYCIKNEDWLVGSSQYYLATHVKHDQNNITRRYYCQWSAFRLYLTRSFCRKVIYFMSCRFVSIFSCCWLKKNLCLNKIYSESWICSLRPAKPRIHFKNKFPILWICTFSYAKSPKFLYSCTPK